VERSICEDKLARTRTDAERITAAWGPVSGGWGDPHKDGLLVLLADRSAELDAVIRRLWDRERLVEAFIALLPDERHRAVLTLRYIDCLRWPQVEEKLKELGVWYDERQMFRLHGAALQAARTHYAAFAAAHPEIEEAIVHVDS